MKQILDIAIELPEKGSHQILRSLHRQLRAAIVDGRLQYGLRLPPTRTLASVLGVSRNTVISAYDMLLSEGYVEGRPGAGTYVANVRPRLETHRLPRQPDAIAAERLALPWRGWKPLAETCSGETYLYDFVAGMPDAEFPFDVWQRLSARATRAVARSGIHEHDPAGEPALRDAIANHVSFVRAVACKAEDVVVTAGARQAIDLIARILVTPGETEVALEDPGYGPTRRSFTGAGAKILSIPVDEEGLIVERLPPSARVICVTPSHQFPLGVAMSTRRRAALLEFAKRFGAVIIEDDYDSEFRHDEMPLDALQTLDRSGAVFYVGTFSKSMFPALRMGFAIIPEWARYALTLAKQLNDWHSPLICQLALADFIVEGHLARHIRKMRKVYSARQDALLSALHTHLGDRLRPFHAHAGVHLAAELSVPKDEKVVVERAAARHMRVEDIARYATLDIAQKGLVFGFGMMNADSIDPAIRKLANILT